MYRFFFWFMVHFLAFEVQNLWFNISCLRCGFLGLGFRVVWFRVRIRVKVRVLIFFRFLGLGFRI